MGNEPRVIMCYGCGEECIPRKDKEGIYKSDCCDDDIVTFVSQNELALLVADLSEQISDPSAMEKQD